VAKSPYHAGPPNESPYTIDIKPSARRELEKLSDGLIARMLPKIEGLAANKDLWRIRVGDYRIVYIIDDTRMNLSITRIAHRQDVYS
jgi:mRNA interferase RelE/StbE